MQARSSLTNPAVHRRNTASVHDLLPLKSMPTALSIHLNGQPRTLEELTSPSDLASVITTLGLKSDRVAVEHNGEIVPRAQWAEAMSPPVIVSKSFIL